MIDVTRMNGKQFTLNSDLIETIEETPDTVLTLTTGKKIIVKESRQKVKNLVKLYQKEYNIKVVYFFGFSINYWYAGVCRSSCVWNCIRESGICCTGKLL